MNVKEAIRRIDWDYCATDSVWHFYTDKGMGEVVVNAPDGISFELLESHLEALGDAMPYRDSKPLDESLKLVVEYTMCKALVKDLRPYCDLEVEYIGQSGYDDSQFQLSSNALNVVSQYGKKVGYNRLAHAMEEELDKMLLENLNKKEVN